MNAFSSKGDSKSAKEYEEKKKKVEEEIIKLNEGTKCVIAPGDVYNSLMFHLLFLWVKI